MVDILLTHHQHPTWTGGRLNLMLCMRMERLCHSSMCLRLWGSLARLGPYPQHTLTQGSFHSCIDLSLDNGRSLSSKVKNAPMYGNRGSQSEQPSAVLALMFTQGKFLMIPYLNKAKTATTNQARSVCHCPLLPINLSHHGWSTSNS